MKKDTKKDATSHLMTSYKRDNLKKHVIRRLALVLPLTILMIILAKTGTIEYLIDHYSFTSESWFSDPALTQHLRVVLTHSHKVNLKPQCILFVVNGNDPLNRTRIEVVEKNAKGCPAYGHDIKKLFTLQVDRINKLIFSDQNSTGQFHEL